MVKKQKFVSHDREILKKKKKRAIDDLVKKKSATVKELLREKRESLAIEPAQGERITMKSYIDTVSFHLFMHKYPLI